MGVMLSGLTPLSATVGTVVDVYGSNFSNATAVYIGATAMAVTFIDSGHLQFVVTAPAVFEGDTFQMDTFYVESGSTISLSGTAKVSVLVVNSDGTSDNWEGFVLHWTSTPPANTLSYLNTPGKIADYANTINPNPIAPAPPLGAMNSVPATVQATSSTSITKQGMVYNQSKFQLNVPQPRLVTTNVNNQVTADVTNVQSEAVKFVDLVPQKIISEVL